MPEGPLARRIRQRKRPVQQRSQATVGAILEATLQILVGQGHAALTTTRVAARAGVSVGTLYQYFPDKASLVVALKVQYFERVVERVVGAARASTGLALEPALRAMISALLSAKRENLQLTLALREPMLEAGGESLVREATRRLIAETEQVLRAAVPQLADPAGAARVLVAAIEGVVSSAVYQDPATLLQRAEFEDELVALAVGYVRERQRR